MDRQDVARTSGVYFVGMNMKNPVLGGAKNLPLRKAICRTRSTAQHVINIVDEGVPIPCQRLVPVGIPGFRATSRTPTVHPYDDAKATSSPRSGHCADAQLLVQHGRQATTSHRRVLQAGWQSVGIHVTLTDFEWGTYLSKLQQPGTQPALPHGLARRLPVHGRLHCTRCSRQRRREPAASPSTPTRRSTSCCSRRAATIDPTQRHNLYAQAEKHILADVPAAPLYFYRDFRVINNRIGGYQHDPMGFTDMWKVWVE